jgi:hypothetical protein
MAVVRLLRRKWPRRRKNGPKRAPRPVSVVRTHERKAPHSAPFRPTLSPGKECPDRASWRREAHSPRTFFSLWCAEALRKPRSGLTPSRNRRTVSGCIALSRSDPAGCMRRRTDRPSSRGATLPVFSPAVTDSARSSGDGGTPTPPAWRDPILAVLQERGGSSGEPVSRTYGHEVVRYRGLSRVGSAQKRPLWRRGYDGRANQVCQRVGQRSVVLDSEDRCCRTAGSSIPSRTLASARW